MVGQWSVRLSTVELFATIWEQTHQGSSPLSRIAGQTVHEWLWSLTLEENSSVTDGTRPTPCRGAGFWTGVSRVRGNRQRQNRATCLGPWSPFQDCPLALGSAPRTVSGSMQAIAILQSRLNTRLLSIIHQQEFDLEGSPEIRWHECLESRRHGGRRQSRQCPTRRGDQLRVDRRRRRPLAVAHLSVQPREPKPRPAKDRLQPAGAKSLRPHRNRTTGLAAASHPEGRGPERRPHRRHPHRDHPRRQ